MGAGSAAVHELRYAIGYRSAAAHELAAHPHGYLSLALPGILTALVISLAALGVRASRGSGSAARSRQPLPPVWLACTIALAAIFATQETLEGAGALAHGGWIGLALAIPVGGFVALGLRAADEAEAGPARAPVLIASAVAVARLWTPVALAAGRTPQTVAGARAPPRSFAF